MRTPLEHPRLDRTGRRLDLQVGATKRTLGSVLGHEDLVVFPADAQVDRALLHLTPARRKPSAHVLRLRQRVEDEVDGSFELPGDEHVEIIRQFVDRCPMTISHCGSPWPSLSARTS